MDAEHLGVLTGLLAVMFSAEPPVGSTLRVERGPDGETGIKWPRGYSMFGVADTDEIASRAESLLRHLAHNGWFDLSGRAEVTIRLGSRARRVFGMKAKQ